MPRGLFSSTGRSVRILLIEADKGDAATLQALLPGSLGFKCEWVWASTIDAARDFLTKRPLDVILLDLPLSATMGIEVLAVVQGLAADKPIVVVTDEVDEDLGVEAVQRGAMEYLVKDALTSRMIARVLRYAIERHRVETQLRHSLLEKETLLREVHHRVKNNLQLILSLLRLGAEHVPDGEARRIFQDSHNRIRSMSMIHENLYRVRDINKVPFHDYVKELMRELFCAHNAWARGIEMELQLAAIELGVDTAIPCGLILHELVTNALEHAFPETGGGAPSGGRRWVRVVFRRMEGDKLHLQVCDNGVGMPPEGEMRKKKSIGLELVTTLAGQLEGELQSCCGTPTCYGIVFPEKRHHGEPRVQAS